MRREESEGLGVVFGEIHELLRARAGLTPHEALEVVLVALELLDSSRIANIKRADSGSDLRTKFLTRAPSIDRDVADAVLTSFERSGWLEMNRELRGPALLHFIPPELRRGLGIFFTPEPLAQALSRAFRLRDGLRIFDPACGAGVLLRDFALRASKEKRRIELFGGEINPALLRLASLHLGSIDPGFRGIRHDALREDQEAERVIPKGSVDLLISNPPYGILLDSSDPALAQFHLARFVKSRLPFELLFIERALGWLSPGGHAALILPRSILTNRGFEEARAALDRVLIPEALISLPAETFAGAGASVSPIVLFFGGAIRAWTHRATSPMRSSKISASIGADASSKARSSKRSEMRSKRSSKTGRSGGLSNDSSSVRRLRFPAFHVRSLRARSAPAPQQK